MLSLAIVAAMLVAFVGLAFAVFVAVTIPASGIAGIAVSLIGVAIAIGSYIVSQRLVRLRNNQIQADIAEKLRVFRLKPLPASIVLWGKSGTVGLGLLLAFFASAAWLMLVTGESIVDSQFEALVWGGILIVCSLMLLALLPATLLKIGKPLLELGSDGLRTPLHGFVAWEEVKGMHLLHINQGKVGEAYNLLVRVPGFKRYGRPWAKYFRFIDLLHITSERKRILNIPLNGTNIHPRVLEAAAQQYWERAVGYAPIWYPSIFDL